MKDTFFERCNELLMKLEWSGIYGYCTELEWNGIYSHYTGYPCCPICKGIKPGHGIDQFGNAPVNTGHSKECSYYGLFEEKL